MTISSAILANPINGGDSKLEAENGGLVMTKRAEIVGQAGR